MMASIDVLSQAKGRKIAVLGDMGELGSEEKKLHGMVGTHFAGKKIDALFVTGTLAGEIAEEARRVAPETRSMRNRTKRRWRRRCWSTADREIPFW